MDLKKQIITFLKSLDVDDVGFADIKLYKRIENGLIPQEMLPSAKTAIVYLYLLKKLEERYGKWYIASLLNFQNRINKKLIELLNKFGYEAKGIGDNEYDRKTLVGKLSFRQLAVLSGLGSIGKNSMLIHKKFGPRIVLGIVLTNAEILPDEPFKDDLCINCGICEKACPVKAICENFDRWKCKNRRETLRKGCGIPCTILCPIGADK